MEADFMAELCKSDLFKGMGREECAVLLSCLAPQLKCFSKNETIFFTGDAVRHIGMILSGKAYAYLEHINGERTVLSVLSPMDLFGELIAATKTQHSPITVCAAQDVRAAFIEYQKVYSICAASCAAHRLFLQNMLCFIGGKFFNLFDRMNILREKTLRDKIMVYLYSLSGNGQRSAVTLPFTKTMLADYLLANRSALSKELRNMERDGLITYKGRTVALKFLHKEQ